ncbi:glycoside hydrolase family 16 protein [Psychroflexus planctonicus]|nr:glycoside hydrolase family 16 protein [Psychroflexus planctonicus]
MIKKIFFSTLMLVFLTSCVDDDYNFGEIQAPTNLQISAEVVGATEEEPFGDGSGRVNFVATADNAINFIYDFGDNRQVNQSGGELTHDYNVVGVNEYIVTVTATGTGGAKTTATTRVEVLSNFDDPVTKSLLTGDDTKTWFVASGEPGHLGVGPLDSFSPDFFAASPNQLASCLYDDSITIALDENNNITFNHDNADVSFVNAEFVSQLGGGGPDDQCLPVDTSGEKFVNLSAASSNVPSDLSTGTQMNISDGGFLSYYINTSSYEVLEITEDYLYVRGISGSSGGPLAWYLKFTTGNDGGGDESELDTQFEDLVWSDEFDLDGAPDPSIWNFEIGNGNGGWGNQESQYYTDENAIVEDGMLKITAKAESTNGFDYSSSRLNTLDNFDFEYGRIEVRAKLPEGGGTWPAIWMMGANFPEVGWPECGEIDIMEHRGNDQDQIHGTLHFPDNSGGNAVGQTTIVEGVSNEFKNYTVEWDDEQIQFAVDNQVYHTFQNSSEIPFNSPFFIILNVAMGGTFGGDIDPAFQESTMEVDYVRVYQ